jgi:hypothetical protein
MQKVDKPMIFNDIFVSKGCPRAIICKAISKSFGIPQNNIFFDNESTEGWGDQPESAFVYSYQKGDIDWKLDVVAKADVSSDLALEQFAKTLAVPVFYDRRAAPYDGRVDVYNPSRHEDAAEILDFEDHRGELTLRVKWGSKLV